MPCEMYLSRDNRYTIMLFRSSVVEGKMRPFGEALAEFVVACGFKGVSVLTGTMSPVRRERTTNRDLPEIFGYVNNNLYKTTLAANDGKSWYEVNQMKKFGWWLGDKK